MSSNADLKHGEKVEIVSSTGVLFFWGEIEGFPYCSNEANEGACDVVLVKMSPQNKMRALPMRFKRCKEVQGCYQVPITDVRRS